MTRGRPRRCGFPAGACAADCAPAMAQSGLSTSRHPTRAVKTP